MVKEGVSGSSPEEGSAKVLLAGFGSERLASRRTCRGIEPLMERSGRKDPHSRASPSFSLAVPSTDRAAVGSRTWTRTARSG
jgi:hypothetical protein